MAVVHVTPSSEDFERVIRSWLVDVVAKPDTRLGRSGGICPVVRRAILADALEVVIRMSACRPGKAELRDLVRMAVRDFDTIQWRSANHGLRALLVAFPGLSAMHAAALDQLHSEMKDFVVRSGMMFAQFHPVCDVRSVRNPDLIVGSSPIPILVFRPMAIHDILFLGERREWFCEYVARFGNLTDQAGAADDVITGAYRSASAKHGSYGEPS